MLVKSSTWLEMGNGLKSFIETAKSFGTDSFAGDAMAEEALLVDGSNFSSLSKSLTQR